MVGIINFFIFLCLSLDKQWIKRYNSIRCRKVHALVAQLDRVFDYESKGQGFESLRARQNNRHRFLWCRLFFLSARVSRSTASLRRGAKQTISGLAQPRRRVQNPFGRAKTKRPTNLEKCGFVGLFLSNDFLDCFGKCSNRVAIEIIFYR